MTGEQHTRYLIACRLMSAYHSRYNNKSTVLTHNWHSTIITLPEGAILSSGLLDEWATIIGKYKKRNFHLTIKNNCHQLEVN